MEKKTLQQQIAASGQLSLPQLEATDGVTLPEEDLLFLEAALQTAEDDPGLRLDVVEVEPACKIGDNFSSVVTRETAYGVRGDGSEYRRSVVVKKASQMGGELLQSSELFWKEAFSYSVLLPCLGRLLLHARPPLPPLPFPECLHASHRVRPNTIILEDLRPAGYAMADRKVGLDAEHALRVMEALGRFHGASLALRRLDPLGFRMLRSRIRELIYYPEGEAVFGPSIRSSIALARMSLRRSGRQDLVERLDGRAADSFAQACEAVVSPPEGDAQVEPCFGHGDFWINNILFKHNNQKLEDVRFLDIASTRCCSPAVDILHFLYTSMSAKVRNNNREALLSRYRDSLQATVEDLVRAQGDCSSLSSSMDSFSLDLTATADAEDDSLTPALEEDTPAVELLSDEVLSMDALRQELQDRAAYGLWHGLWMMPAVFFDSDNLPSSSDEPVDWYAEDTLSRLCSNLPQAFHQRVLEHVQEFVETGYL